MTDSKPKLLIVEDDESIRTQMKWAMAQDYEVFLAEDRRRALETLKKEKIPVMILDLGLPPHPAETAEGFAALSEVLEWDNRVKVIVVTGQGEKGNALRAIQQGAYDFFAKPIQIEEVKVVLGRAYYVSRIEKECQGLKESLQDGSFEGILGTSSKIQEVFSSIRKVATTDAPVLITGESGTGKELVARAIHRLSLRKKGAFVPINCGAIPETLLESELFGHEKGSFTGAHVQRKGRFEMAEGGSLFLDEVGELPIALQVKLLRFLQEQKIERIGGREEIFVNTRVLAATNKDIKQAMNQGQFREDLYYRLSVVTVSLPPLRERGGDTLLIAMSLLQKYAKENNRKITGFTKAALQAIESHDWPGNVRELENRIKRAVIMAEGTRVNPSDMELIPFEQLSESKMGLKEAREVVEKEMIERSLIRNKGNVTRAAAELGVSRPTLYELMEKLGIEKK